MSKSKTTQIPEGPWSLGAEVRRRRTDLGLTIEELAIRSGLSANFVGTIENGHRDPSLSTLLALAKGLETSIRDLFPGDDNLSPLAMEIGRAFDSSPVEIKEGVSTVLRYHGGRRNQRRG